MYKRSGLCANFQFFGAAFIQMRLLLKGQCHDIQWFFFLCFFCTSKTWRLLQMSRTSDHDSSVRRTSSFTAQAESSNCRFPPSNCCFPWPCLAATHIFSHTTWLPKITDYRDTATVKGGLYAKFWVRLTQWLTGLTRWLTDWLDD